MVTRGILGCPGSYWCSEPFWLMGDGDTIGALFTMLLPMVVVAEVGMVLGVGVGRELGWVAVWSWGIFCTGYAPSPDIWRYVFR